VRKPFLVLLGFLGLFTAVSALEGRPEEFMATGIAAFLAFSWVIPAWATRNAQPEVFLLSTVGMCPLRVLLAVTAVAVCLYGGADPLHLTLAIWGTWLPVLLVEVLCLHGLNTGGVNVLG